MEKVLSWKSVSTVLFCTGIIRANTVYDIVVKICDNFDPVLKTTGAEAEDYLQGTDIE